jgi:hypothetical protein
MTNSIAEAYNPYTEGRCWYKTQEGMCMYIGSTRRVSKNGVIFVYMSLCDNHVMKMQSSGYIVVSVTKVPEIFP